MESRNLNSSTNRISGSTPIKVLFLMDCLYGDAGGGSERQFLRFYELCREYGIDPHVCFLRHRSVHDQVAWGRDPLTLNVQRILSFSSIRAASRMARYVKSHKIQLVQTLFDDAAIFGGILYPMVCRSRPKIIVGLRNSGHMHKGILKILLTIAYRNADHFLVNASFIASHLENSFHVDRSKVSVISNLYRRAQPNPASDAAEIGTAIRSRFKWIALIVANMRPIKGIEDLLLTVQTLKRPDLCFILVGEGDNRTEYEDLAKRIGVYDQVVFLGRRDDVQEFIEIADLALLTSHSEGLSNSLLEYAAGGLPIVATDVGGNAEIVSRDSGILVPVSDIERMAESIKTILANYRSFRVAADLQSKEIIRRHSDQFVMNQTSNLYTQCAGDSVEHEAG